MCIRDSRRPEERRRAWAIRLETGRGALLEQGLEMRQASLREQRIEKAPIGSVPPDDDGARAGRSVRHRRPGRRYGSQGRGEQSGSAEEEVRASHRKKRGEAFRLPLESNREKSSERDAGSDPEQARRLPRDVLVEVRVAGVRGRIGAVLAGLTRGREDGVTAGARRARGRAEHLVARRDGLDVRGVEDVDDRRDRDAAEADGVLEVQVDVIRGREIAEAAARHVVKLLAVAGARIAADGHRPAGLERRVRARDEAEGEGIRARELELVRAVVPEHAVVVRRHVDVVEVRVDVRVGLAALTRLREVARVVALELGVDVAHEGVEAVSYTHLTLPT